MGMSMLSAVDPADESGASVVDSADGALDASASSRMSAGVSTTGTDVGTSNVAMAVTPPSDEPVLGAFEVFRIVIVSLSILACGIAIYYYKRDQHDAQERSSEFFGDTDKQVGAQYKTDLHWTRVEEVPAMLGCKFPLKNSAVGGAVGGGGQQGGGQQPPTPPDTCEMDVSDEFSVAGITLLEHSTRQARFGLNKITPAVKENKWIALLRITFLTGFNILLWACVFTEVALTLMIKQNVRSWSDVQNLGLSMDLFSHMITPLILSAVIVASSLLQWWSEQRAESMLESLGAMQTKERIKVLRISTDLASGKEKRY